MQFRSIAFRLLVAGAVVSSLPVFAQSQFAQAGSRTAPVLVRQPVDARQTTALPGTVRPDIVAHPDLGRVDDNFRLNHIYVVLKRSPQQEADLDDLLEQLQQKGSPSYHRWLTSQQFGQRFGLSGQDIQQVAQWLQSRGLTVNGVLHNGTMIDIAATAAQLRTGLGVELHNFGFDKDSYFANVTDPKVPVALSSVVAAFHGLNNFPLKAMHTKPHQFAREDGKWRMVDAREGAPTPGYTSSDESQLLVAPQDFWTIYNINPVFSGITKGANATIAVAEQSDIVYGTVSSNGAATGGDVTTFRNLFGVNAQSSTFNFYVYHGYGSVSCVAPGIDPYGDEEDAEASLDAEWATALAPSAKLIFMSCSPQSDDGIFSSLTALIDNNLADAISTSYGESEIYLETSNYTAQNALWQQAAAQGQSIIFSAGDSGSDVADQDTKGFATNGLNVSGYSASPLVTSAGGTDFQDVYDYQICSQNSSNCTDPYWSTTNSQYYGSVLSYVPEKTWNNSCADSMFAVYSGYSDPASSCNAQYSSYGEGDVTGGSGGVSSVYTQPAYQKGITGLSLSITMRAQPDISFFAANGFWSHYMFYCDSTYAASNCSGVSDFGGAGGTSFVAPQIAGITGLLVSYTGERQGVLNYALYSLAKTQFASSSNSSCYASGSASNTGTTVSLPASTCIFNDVTGGNNSEACQKGALNCYSPGSYGVLSTSTSAEQIAYPAAPGYDLATGVGSANIYNLLTKWNTAFSTTTTLKTSAASISSTQSVTLTATVTDSVPNGTAYPPATGTITFKDNTNGTTLGTCALSGGSCTLSVAGTKLTTGSNSIVAQYAGTKQYPASTSAAVSVTLTESSATTTTVLSVAPSTSFVVGTTATLTATITASSGTANGGTVSFYADGELLGSGTVVNGKATFTAPTANQTAGTYSATAVYNGTTGYTGSTSPAVRVTLTAAATTTSLSASPTTVTPPAAVTLTATVTGGSAGNVTGTVTFMSSGYNLGTATVTNGKAVLTKASTNVIAGTYQVTAHYNGNNYYTGSTSGGVPVTVK